MISRIASASFFAMLSFPALAADIQFWYGATGANWETAVQNACGAFNKSQTEHKITCVGQGGYEAGMQAAIAAVRANQHPVLLQIHDAGTLDLMLSGAVEPVANVLPKVDWDSYIGGARSYYETSTGALFSQPYNASTLIFYGNKSLLAKAGIETLPKTYEELATAAGQLKDAGVECPVVTDLHPWRVLEEFGARHGISIATKGNGYGGLNAEYAFNTGLFVDHLSDILTWRKDGLVKLASETRAGNFTDAFLSGECALIETSTASYGAAHKALGENLVTGLAPVYAGHERYNTFVGGASIWIMKGHSPEEITAAGAFLDFVRQPEQQIELTRLTGFVPVTNNVLTVMEKQGLLSDPAFGSAKLAIDSMSFPTNEFSRGVRLGFYVQFRSVFTEELQKAVAGNQTVQVALDNAKRRGDELLRRFEQTYRGVKLP